MSSNPNPSPSFMTLQKWGALASLLMVVTFIGSSLIYLMGNLRDALGPLAYALADFLYGPVWAASLVVAIFALHERLGEQAPRRLRVAVLAACVAASVFVAVACVRSANRHYHLTHPDLHLESSVTVLIVWATLVAGLIGAAWHFWGWVLVLVGSVGWTSRRLPRVVSALYVVAGTVSLFVYVLPNLEDDAMAFSILVSIWQAIWLWRAESGEASVPKLNASQLGQA